MSFHFISFAHLDSFSILLHLFLQTSSFYCFSIQTGALIIGWLGFIVSIILVSASGYYLSFFVATRLEVTHRMYATAGKEKIQWPEFQWILLNVF